MFSQWGLELTESVFGSLVLELNVCTTVSVPDAFFFLFQEVVWGGRRQVSLET